MNGRKDNDPEEGWAYGDVWKNGSADDLPADDYADYVEVLRGDTGMGLDDSVMMEYVLFLGEHDILSTFDSFPLEQIKIYVLKAESGKAAEAMRLLTERRRTSR